MNHVKVISFQADSLLQTMGEIDAEHWFVTIGPNCWGRGVTIKAAFATCKSNAPRGKSVYFVTRVAPREGFEVDPIDGSIWWDNAKHDAKACPICSVGKGLAISVS